MSSIENKIDIFQKSCYEMAKNDANILKTQTDEKIKKTIKEETKIYQEEANRRYEKKSSKIEQDYNCKIFEEENNARYSIIEVEKQIKKDIKDTVTEKIEKFVNSEKYKKFLFDNIKKSIEYANVEEGNSIKIMLVKKDYENYKNEIEQLFLAKVDCMPSSNIGGAICINESKNVLINNTLKTLIEENL